jgi:hypothetical protein
VHGELLISQAFLEFAMDRLGGVLKFYYREAA